MDPSPAVPLLDLLAEQQRTFMRLLHLPRVLDAALHTRPGATPADVVLQKGRFKLLRYRRATPATYAEPVLFCYALINRPYILDLLPGKSVAERYLQAGHDVYLIDWGTPTHADRAMTIEHHVCGFLSAAIAFVLGQHGRRDLHLLGYCMGGTMAALHTALEPESVKTLTLLAAPIDFSQRDGLLNLWTDARHFDVDAFVDRHGNCPGWFLQTCFVAMRPVQNLIEKHVAFLEQMDDPESVASHLAMERWVNDNIAIPGETFREFVKSFYQANALVRGEWHMGGRRVDLGRIACPLLLLTATNDHLVPPSSTEGIRSCVGSRDIRSIEVKAGHVGLVVGSKARRTLWPEATQWLAERSTALPHPSSTRA